MKKTKTGAFLAALLIVLSQATAFAACTHMLGVTDQAVSLWERNGSIPVAEDALVRMLVLQAISRDGNVKEVIERVNTVERLINQRIVARARDHKWTAKAEGETPALQAV